MGIRAPQKSGPFYPQGSQQLSSLHEVVGEFPSSNLSQVQQVRYLNEIEACPSKLIYFTKEVQ